MKLFSMYRRKKAGKSVTSHSTYDATSLTSLRSLDDSLQVQTEPQSDDVPTSEEPKPQAAPVDDEDKPSSAGDAQPIEVKTDPPTETTTTPSSNEEDDEIEEKMKTKSKREDTYEERERREKEEAMMSLWRKSALPKKLAVPTKYPSYLKEPPELSYEETHAYLRRKMYNYSRIKMSQETDQPKPPSKTQKTFEPKSNKTVQLRSTYIRRDPVVSQYFSDHYNEYKKPPFRNTNVKFCN